ncbi:hypothetical protein ACOSOMT5_P1674 [Acidiphilium sp. MT5]
MADHSSFATITRPRLLLIRLLATTVLVIGFALILLFQPNRLPFHLPSPSPSGASPITARQHTKLPANLHPGDLITIATQPLITREIMVFPNVPSNHTYPAHIIRAGQPLTVTLQSQPTPDEGTIIKAANNLFFAITMAFALVTLWRGADWTAWGLTIFALALIINAAALTPPLPPPFNVLAGVIFIFAVNGLPIFGLYISALNVVAPRPRTRRWLNRSFIPLLIATIALELIPPLALIYRGINTQAALTGITLVMIAIAVLTPVLILTIGYLRASLQQKLRIRWFLVGTSLIIVLFALGVIPLFDQTPNPTIHFLFTIGPTLVFTIIFTIFAYAATTQRLIDVRIVVSRAMLVTALISIIVASLGASERLIVSSALGSNASHALELTVALGVGILFHQAQRWIEAAIDRLFFWREHQARAQLRDFVRDAGFIESTDILTTRIVTALAQRLDAPGAALYEWRGDLIERTAQTGTQPYPPTLDPDDPALVRLRATRAPLDLHGLNSSLDTDGMALPLALRGRLFGVIACRPRTAGKYAQSEMDELGRAAHDTGAALFALRARANETLIEQLATNRITAQQAITEARTLTGL